jgi:nitrogen fixation NifU-like protein
MEWTRGIKGEVDGGLVCAEAAFQGRTVETAGSIHPPFPTHVIVAVVDCARWFELLVRLRGGSAASGGSPRREGRGMKSEFERFVEWLEREVDDDARSAFSDTVIHECFAPSNFERLARPDAYALVKGRCGDTMEIFLLLDGDTIAHASFTTDGCGATVACGSMLTKMAKGLSLSDAGAIEPKQLCEALGGLPDDHLHCADLAVMTLRKAIEDAREA